ncbi:hypothetical protein HOC80_00530 [archaeon]|nr:hypothetical protein [archaeon]MBT4416571.1 hypothetical protein [archaeon]
MKKILLLGIIMLALITACSQSPTSNAVATGEQELTLEVDIPCPGHASLITQELYTINGVIDVKYSSPNIYDITYDSTVTSEEEIQSLDVFNEYPCQEIK